MTKEPVLTVERAYRSYRKGGLTVPVLRDLSLSVTAGDFVVVMGPSGCGKSTLLLCCGALLSPNSGIVRVNGVNPYSLPPNRRAGFRAGNIGFVFQQFHLIPYLSVRDNVLVAAHAAKQADAARKVDELLDAFGLSERAEHMPSELSVGERQRTALTRALLNRPGLLLADEPTGNLDKASGSVVLQALARFARDGGAVLMVTHDDGAAGLASRVITMDAGRLTG
jgi:ABC-type lipoprotein export system ATPase subunit